MGAAVANDLRWGAAVAPTLEQRRPTVEEVPTLAPTAPRGLVGMSTAPSINRRSNYTFSLVFLPNSPDGLINSTRIRIANAAGLE